MTVRRRFLLASSLVRLIQRERGCSRQIEGFFPEQRDRASWVRLEENKGLLILRTAGPDGHIEEVTEVPVPHAQALLDVCAGEIDYARTKLPIGGRIALIDQVLQPCAVHLVSVEFGHDEEASGFRPLPWFGPEVTGDARYTNQSLALRRLTEAPDTPLTNEALSSLLDTLESRFPAQPRVPMGRPTARQVPVTTAPIDPAAGNGQSAKVDLAELEAAMRREMEQSLQNSRSS